MHARLVPLLVVLALAALASPAVAGHDVLQPGDPTSVCTLAWVLDGGPPPEDQPTAEGAEGDAVYFVIAGHCLAEGDRITSPGFGTFGTAVYDNDPLDVALIQVDEALEDAVVPRVKGHGETPTGLATSQSYETGDTVLQSGYGTGFNAAAESRENRAGVLLEDPDDGWGWKAVTPVSFGDSGGPVVYGVNGSALGIVNVLPDPTDAPPGTGAGLSMDQILSDVRGAGFDVELRTVACGTCYGDDAVRRTEAVSASEDARLASAEGDAHGGTAAASLRGDARGGVAASATGDAQGLAAAAGTGNASGFAAGASGAGDATGFVAAAPVGDASGLVGASATGNASGLLAASGVGDASGLVAASALGDASGAAAVTATGDATGLVPVSATGSCSNGGGPSSDCVDATPGSSRGHNAAASPTGEARCTGNPVCVSASGTGDAYGPVAVAGTGDATGLVAASGTGEAGEGAAAASGTGDARAAMAFSGTGQADGFLLEASGCEEASDRGVDAACASPTGRVLP